MRLASANHPGRYGQPPLDRYGARIVALQEVRGRLRVAGWRIFRPAVNRSTSVAWDGPRLPKRNKGRVRVGWSPAPRYLTWVRFQGVTVASVHLPAFKHRNGSQHRRQMARIASWLAKHPDAVLMGDFNCEPDSTWTRPLRDVGASCVSAATHGKKHLDQAWSISTRLRLVGTVATRSDHRALVVESLPR